jgi:hypothetical protein
MIKMFCMELWYSVVLEAAIHLSAYLGPIAIDRDEYVW